MGWHCGTVEGRGGINGQSRACHDDIASVYDRPLSIAAESTKMNPIPAYKNFDDDDAGHWKVDAISAISRRRTSITLRKVLAYSLPCIPK